MKLSKKELTKKKEYHEKRVKYYQKKIDEVDRESKLIGFKRY